MRKFFVMYFSLSASQYSTSLKMYKVEGSTTQEQSFCIISESFLGSRFFTMHALLLKKYVLALYLSCTQHILMQVYTPSRFFSPKKILTFYRRCIDVYRRSYLCEDSVYANSLYTSFKNSTQIEELSVGKYNNFIRCPN